MKRLQPAILLAIPVLLAACAGVLGLKKAGDTSHPFEHKKHTTAGVNCVKCHEGISGAGEEGDLHLPTTEKCVSCHSKPHDPRPCANCHGDSATRAGSVAARKYLRFAHTRHLPKVKDQCVPCHAAAGTDAAVLRPPMAQCFGCHGHKDQWNVRNCDACHIDLPSERTKPASHIVHDGDFVREHGVRAASVKDLCATCHTQSSCDVCHGATTPALPWKFNTEKPSFARLHPGNFMARHPDEARAQPALCITCHAETQCVACHLDRKVAAKPGIPSPHPPGWVRAAAGGHGRAARLDPQSCAACHGGAGEMLCVGCHRVGGPGGNIHGPGFSSNKDKLKDEPCRMCHSPA